MKIHQKLPKISAVLLSFIFVLPYTNLMWVDLKSLLRENDDLNKRTCIKPHKPDAEDQTI